MDNYLIKRKNKVMKIDLLWSEKYRPETLDDFILDSSIKNKINGILSSKNLPNIIITGPISIGKTSLGLYLVNNFFEKDSPEVIQLNASDDRGLSTINSKVKPFCKKKTLSKFKVVLLDEADSITSKAQNLLSDIIDEFKKNNRFIFICNDSSKIVESIQSNCTILKLPILLRKNIKDKLLNICKLEKIKVSSDFINNLIKLSDNDIRKSINNLETLVKSNLDLNIDSLYKLVDVPKPIYINKIINYLDNKKPNEAIKIIKELYDKGYTPSDILLNFMNIILESEHPKKLEIYKIISVSFIKINNGVDNLLQLVSCICKLSILLNSDD